MSVCSKITLEIDFKNLKFSGYFEEKAMPSAGFYTFAKSWLCTFNNTCLENEWTVPWKYQSYNDSL